MSLIGLALLLFFSVKFTVVHRHRVFPQIIFDLTAVVDLTFLLTCVRSVS
jgi:hypothetical protein